MKTFNNFVIYSTNPSHVVTASNPGGIYSSMSFADGAVAELFGGTMNATGDGVETFDVRITAGNGNIYRFGNRVRTRGVSSEQVTAVMLEYQRRANHRHKRQQHRNRVAQFNNNR